jgi:hypothetical protein
VSGCRNGELGHLALGDVGVSTSEGLALGVVDDLRGLDPVEDPGANPYAVPPAAGMEIARAGLTAWNPSAPMPPHRPATPAEVSCRARNDALGYQTPTAQSSGVNVATRGPWTRSATPFRAPGRPKGLSWAWAKDQCENAPWMSTRESMGLSAGVPTPARAKETRRAPKLCPSR